jgi:ATP-dependent Clp protease ATP-binding subunit ClpC
MRWRKKSGEEPAQTPELDIDALERELGARIGERGRAVLTFACAEVARSNHRELGAEHLMVGLVLEGGRAADLLAEHGIRLEDARAGVAEALWEEDFSGELSPNSEVWNILHTATETAGMRGQAALEPEHILYGLSCAGFEITSRVLQTVGVDRQKLLQAADQVLNQAS